MEEILQTYFIERPCDYGWSRYAGPFDQREQAVRYLEALCGPKFRVTRYEAVDVGRTDV